MDDVERCWRVACYLREAGFSPLPSRRDRKRPDLETYRYESESESQLGIRQDLCDRFASPAAWKVPNVQLMCGTRCYGARKILVVDCDGEEATEAWEILLRENGGDPPSWSVLTGSGGRHHYYAVPSGAGVVRSGLLWGLWDTRGRWAKHQALQLLGDGALAVAPPSLHVETGRRYVFQGNDPRSHPEMAEAPAWLLGMPRLGKPSFPHERPDRPRLARIEGPLGEGLVSREEVIAAIPDTVAVAESWGLVFRRKEPNAAGWVSCYADANDREPSGSFHPEKGVYMDMRTFEKISLFDLGVRLGAFLDWVEAKRWCEGKFVSPYRRAVKLGEGS